jgi:hypothetical protein
MKPLLLLAMISTLLAACAENEKSKADLALACQLNTCICAGPDKLFVKKADPEPVLWKENGDAYCPEGLKLKLANEKRN